METMIEEQEPATDARLEASAQMQDISKIATPNVIENVELVKHLQALGDISTGNDLQFYNDPDVQFRTMWGAMEQAKQCILVETYIFDPDGVGLHTIEILEAAAKRGVKVFLIMDGFGSNKMIKKGDKPLRKLKELGGVVCYYNPIVKGLRHNFKQNVLLRDHRKILVVDWVLGYTGGINYSKEFGGLETYGDDFFRDTLIQIRGPAVSKLTSLVCELVVELKTARVLGPDVPVPLAPAGMFDPQTNAPAPCGTYTAQILEADPSKIRNTVQTSMLFMIRYAKKYVHITNPYFMPVRAFSKELIATAKRGVPVSIIAAGHCDHYSVHLAAQHVYRKLLKNGVRIFELQNHTLHAKTIVVDGAVASVGSYNLDLWSGWTSLEATVNLFDEGSVRELERHFEIDMAVCKEVTYDELMGRSVARRFSYWTALNVMKLIRVNKSLASTFDKSNNPVPAPTAGAPPPLAAPPLAAPYAQVPTSSFLPSSAASSSVPMMTSSHTYGLPATTQMGVLPVPMQAGPGAPYLMPVTNVFGAPTPINLPMPNIISGRTTPPAAGTDSGRTTPTNALFASSFPQQYDPALQQQGGRVSPTNMAMMQGTDGRVSPVNYSSVPQQSSLNILPSGLPIS